MRTKEFENYKGKLCKVKVNHVLYGEQTIEAVIDIICNEEKFGVVVKNQEIFLFNDEIKVFDVNNNAIHVAGELLEIKIKRI